MWEPTTEFAVLQLFLLGGLCVSAGFLGYCLQHREKRGVTSLVVLFTGVGIWILSELIQIQLRGAPYAGFGMAVRILGIEVTVVGMLFLGLEYTGRERYLDWRLAALCSVVPIIEVALALFPSRAVLFETRLNDAVPWGYELIQTPLFLAHTAYSYLFIFVSLGLLAAMMLRANTGYRRQLAAVFVAILFPTAVNVAFHFGLSPFDLTPVSFVGTAAVLMFATFRLRLLDTIPVARQTVLEEMEDMVVVLDEDNDIITTNSAARRQFGLDSSPAGQSASELFGPEAVDQIISEDDQQLDLTVDGETRVINVSSSPITDYRDNLLARVVVCRDITEQREQERRLRRREEELELLKDLQSRFLRHNLRNELNVVRANAELLADMDDPQQRARYETIVEKTDRILDWSAKARLIEQLIETDNRITCDLSEQIDSLLADLRDAYPEVSFEFETDRPATVAAAPQISHALRNVLDNAARYNTATEPRVRISIDRDGDGICLQIADNGPGIDRHEIEALRDERETQLRHGTGLGLWLVYWVMDKSDGDLSFEVDDGTTVILTFEPAEREAPPAADKQPLTADGGEQ
ncbi:PAS domain S-box protein [Halovenus sp. WSH3]|uniref:PAS domain S-box protein n=1 Tax=Halovenus carboxidivorans TaxID=2692199 RepID=A0A6B0T468_9EURY|nr:histidine kinase N-terminal 7TM domain-containing protein [Halovenus carboxidivorans]MXR50082.1 PAS domain S-box protein [Halovenus carboxidivorans]